MARAGKALKRVLTHYGISQNQLATTMGIDRSNVSRWVSESRDPSAEAVAQIKQALVRLQPPAAEDFVQFYLYEGMEDTSTDTVSVASSQDQTRRGNGDSGHVPMAPSPTGAPSNLAPIASRHPGYVI